MYYICYRTTHDNLIKNTLVPTSFPTIVGMGRSLWSKGGGFFIMTKLITFSIDKRNECLDFSNGYWYPIEDFTRINYLGISEGLFHLSKKEWVNSSLFNSLVLFVKKEYPNFDLTKTLKYFNHA